MQQALSRELIHSAILLLLSLSHA